MAKLDGLQVKEYATVANLTVIRNMLNYEILMVTDAVGAEKSQQSRNMTDFLQSYGTFS